MFPYIDLAGVQRRSFLRPSYFTDNEVQTPGFTAQSIASNSSSINSRLRKRYGAMLPFGQTAPVLLSSGILPPPQVTLTGRPTLGSYLIVIRVTTPGPLGTAVVQWSADGGITWTNSVTTTDVVQLGTTGLTALFPAGTYDSSNYYAAAPPVPETILRWLTTLVTFDVFRRHGVNPNDPQFLILADEVKQVRAEIEEAANSQTGLFDLPASEDEGSAIDTGGPMSYSEQSPYTWAAKQACAAQQEECATVQPCPPNSLVGS